LHLVCDRAGLFGSLLTYGAQHRDRRAWSGCWAWWKNWWS